jgi:hypothetical protein
MAEVKETYSPMEVSVMCKCSDSTARKWAAKNGVSHTGEGKRKDFHFTLADIERFKVRPKPGRRW